MVEGLFAVMAAVLHGRLSTKSLFHSSLPPFCPSCAQRSNSLLSVRNFGIIGMVINTNAGGKWATLTSPNFWSFAIVQGRTVGEILNFSLTILCMLHNEDLALMVNYE